MMWFLNDCTVPSHMCAENVFTDDEVSQIVAMGLQFNEEKAEIVGPIEDVSKLDTSVRNNSVRALPPKQEAQWIYEKVASAIDGINKHSYNYDVLYFDDLMMLEYKGSEKGHYIKHIDCSYDINASFALRKLSFIMQLSSNDDYEGGDLIIYPDTNVKKKIVIPKKRGLITVFPSNIIHEVTPVTKGNRLSLITWVYGPKFK